MTKRKTAVYDSDYKLLSSHSSRAAAMDEAERRAGGEATCEIDRRGDGFLAVYRGPSGEFAVTDLAAVCF